MEHGKVQIGSEILLRISRQFGKPIEWLLTGEDRHINSEREVTDPDFSCLSSALLSCTLQGKVNAMMLT